MKTATAVVTLLAMVALGAPTAASAAPLPKDDNFYTYSHSAASLAAKAPGAVLKSRPVRLHLSGVPTPFDGFQLLFRTTTQLGKATVTVASVLEPKVKVFTTPRLVSDQYPYDALDGKCDPSYYVSGGSDPSGGTSTADAAYTATLLGQGYTVVTSDYEGEDLAFTAPQQSGMQTLDGIRAALNSPDVDLPRGTPVGIAGYSGGAIASEWAAELQPGYAPELSKQLVGTAIGGIYSDPAHNLRYVDGTPVWAGVIPEALVGLTRGFKIDIDKFASPYGKTVFAYSQGKCIPDFLAHYPGLTFAKLVKPQYADVAKVRTFVQILNKSIMSTVGTPSTPLLMVQGLNGTADGTPGNTPGIGPGDGVMVAGDNRTLARTYCRRGLAVDYIESAATEHVSTMAPFFADATTWLGDRFDAKAAPNTCAGIGPGNSLAPLPVPRSDPQAASAEPVQAASTTHHSTVSSNSTRPSAAGANALADTGPQQTQRLLLWAALLLCLGGGLLVAARQPRAMPADPVQLTRRPLPGPMSATRRPLPYLRD